METLYTHFARSFSLAFALVVLCLNGWTQTEEAFPQQSRIHAISEVEPMARLGQPTTPPPTTGTPQAMWDLQFNYNISNSVGNAGLAGVVFTGTEFWISEWSTNNIHITTPTGNLVASITIPGLSGVRSMTWDGTYIYAGNASNQIFEIDPALQSITGIISLAPNVTTPARFVTYDATANGGSGGFWIGNYGDDIYLVDRNGNLLNVILASTHGLTAVYGAVVDNISQGGPYLWAFDQGTNPNSTATIFQLQLPTGVQTGIERDVKVDLNLTASNALAGGMFLSNGLVAGQYTLGGIMQDGPDRLFGYELDFVPAQTDASLRSLNIGEYTQTPLNQIQPINFTGSVQNVGQFSISNYKVKVEVVNGGNVVYTDSTNFSTLSAGNTQNYNLGPFTPANIGNYSIRSIVEVLGTQIDQNTSNDQKLATLIVTDSTYARDNNIISGSLGIGAGGAQNGIIGQNFTYNNPTAITSISAFLNNPSVGETVEMLILNTNVNGAPILNSLLDETVSYTITQTDADSGVFLTLPLTNGPLPLASGEYFFGIREGDSLVSLAYTNDIFTLGKSWVYWTQNGWSNSEDFSFNVSYILRPNTGEVCQAYNLNANIAQDSCQNTTGAIDLNVSGGSFNYAYSWNNGSSSSSISNLNPGNYTVTITGGNGCDTTATFTVGSVGTPITYNTNTTNSTCAGADGSATINVTSGNTGLMYSWSDGQTGATASNLAAGNYSVYVVDGIGCDATASITILDDGAPQITNLTSVDVNCAGGTNGTASVTVSGGVPGYTYSWSNGSVSSFASGLTAGNYDVYITDSDGCTVLASVSIDEPDSIIIDPTITDISCAGETDGEVTVSVSGGVAGYSYSWSNGGTGATISNLLAGSYTVTVTDMNNCTESYMATISEPSALNLNTQATDVSCSGVNDGSINVGISGGTPGYNYSWSNGSTSPNLSNIGDGDYTITITDARGCEISETVSITEPTLLTITPLAFPQTASATVVVNGGVPPYSFSWNTTPIQTDSIATGLSSGNYVATVTDANGCQEISTIFITVSIEDQLNAGISLLDIYPNPSEGNFQIKVELDHPSSLNIELLEMTGKSIYQQQTETLAQHTENLHLPELAQGIYLLKISTEQGEVVERIIIK